MEWDHCPWAVDVLVFLSQESMCPVFSTILLVLVMQVPSSPLTLGTLLCFPSAYIVNEAPQPPPPPSPAPILIRSLDEENSATFFSHLTAESF